tara:strand:- start:253 stop:669 length:417 start_codon:yes stop_codon:yes gene_type:complete
MIKFSFQKIKNMYIQRAEKALSSITINAVVDLNYLNSYIKAEEGYVYTIYSQSDQTIKIGYTKKIGALNNSSSSNTQVLIEKRGGTKREVKLLKATLKELGFNHRGDDSIYKYSHKLIRHLLILGWPARKLNSFESNP